MACSGSPPTHQPAAAAATTAAGAGAAAPAAPAAPAAAGAAGASAAPARAAAVAAAAAGVGFVGFNASAAASRLRPQGDECLPLISTDALIEPTYRDTRTVIYIWGRRLWSEWNGCEGEKGGGGGRRHAKSSSLCHPLILHSLSDVRVVDVVVGDSHALFLADSGDLFAFGRGVYGQLGLGEVQLLADQPQKVKNITQHVVQIAAGDFHSLALTDEGTVYSWGGADCVGDGSGLNRFFPCELRLSDALPARGAASPVCRRIAARYLQSMAVMAGGQLLVWGHLFHARFFHAPRVTFVFSSARKVVQIAIGKAFALALTDQGQLLAWGDGTYGELAGSNFHVGSFAFEEVTLRDANGQQLPPILHVAAGARHALLVAQDLRLWAFGDNLAGQCGVPGHQTKLTTPKLVRVGELRSRVARVACGHRHSGCITPNNQLYMWGHSSSHKLIFTAATEAVISEETQPGVAIRSGLKNAYCRARLIYSLLHQKVTQLALGSEFTVVVTGDGGADSRQSGPSSSSTSGSQEHSTESWASPHVVTAADLHLATNGEEVDAKREETEGGNGSDLPIHPEASLANGEEAAKDKQEEDSLCS
ncbi:hypothetical protein Efla_000229 [Eimeria flavescens]